MEHAIEADLDQAGYREIEHTADRELEVWALDMALLMETAARGMYAIGGARTGNAAAQPRTITLQAEDPETLLATFLTELLYILETERIVFEEFQISETAGAWQARLEGKPLVSLEKEIKAVTYHQLEVRRTEQGLKVNIVFDV